MKLNDLKYKITRWFFPCHNRLRKIIPRHWYDSDYVMEMFLFELVKEFVEDEVGGVDEVNKKIKFYRSHAAKRGLCWENDRNWGNFYAWLLRCYKYITVERPKLESVQSEAYPDIYLDQITDIRTTKEHNKLYEKANKIENKIVKLDNQYLREIVEKRGYFWT